MALRVLSGMLFIPRGGIQRGSAEIGFNPFALIQTSNALFELRKRREIGPAGRFVARPASIVSARQFATLIPNIPLTDSEVRVVINDTVTRDSITISWSAPEEAVFEEEIPFMIVGEVPDPVVRPVTRPGVVPPRKPTVPPPRRSRTRRARKKR